MLKSGILLSLIYKYLDNTYAGPMPPHSCTSKYKFFINVPPKHGDAMIKEEKTKYKTRYLQYIGIYERHIYPVRHSELNIASHAVLTMP